MDQMIEHELLPRGPRKVHEPIYMCIYSRDDDTIYIYIQELSLSRTQSGCACRGRESKNHEAKKMVDTLVGAH